MIKQILKFFKRLFSKKVKTVQYYSTNVEYTLGHEAGYRRGFEAGIRAALQEIKLKQLEIEVNALCEKFSEMWTRQAEDHQC